MQQKIRARRSTREIFNRGEIWYGNFQVYTFSHTVTMVQDAAGAHEKHMHAH